MVTAGQINTGGSHSLTWSIGQPGKSLVGDLIARKILVDRLHVNDKAMPAIAFWNHESTNTILGVLCKPADGASL